MFGDFFLKRKAKKELFKVFRLGQIGLSYKVGTQTRYRYPKLYDININEQRLRYVFSIPCGYDPKELHKKQWLFEQVFSDNIEFKEDGKRFILKVFNGSFHKNVKWDYGEFISNFKGQIPVVCGVDQHGQLHVYDMVENPHLLIAGFTGSGKSTQLRSVLTVLIKFFTPEQLQLHLIDMKAVELTLFRNVKHVKGNIITKGKDVKPLLKQINKEMDRRQDLMEKERVTHITQLKKKQSFIILAIDELASLPNDKELHEYLVEISNRGRALGVFAICSVLRPDSVNIDSRLKGNLTVTMGFRARDKINARVIGMFGAEKLKEVGRFLINFPKYDDNIELQAPYLSEKVLLKELEGYRYTEEEILENEQKQAKTIDKSKVINTHNSIKENKIQLGLLGDDHER